jgi:uncharacterized membrane protein
MEALALLASLALAIWMKPWRLLADDARLSPLLAPFVLIPWIWTMPETAGMPVALHWSGACMAMLMVGWPLAVPLFICCAGASMLLAPISLGHAVELAFWLGVAPASLGVVAGAALRRVFGAHLFAYILCRGFAFTLAIAASCSAAAQTGSLAMGVKDEASIIFVALWLNAWGEAVATGMLVACMVAYAPKWLATWSDKLYLRKPKNPPPKMENPPRWYDDRQDRPPK